jgi:hypothetical protein
MSRAAKPCDVRVFCGRISRTQLAAISIDRCAKYKAISVPIRKPDNKALYFNDYFEREIKRLFFRPHKNRALFMQLLQSTKPVLGSVCAACRFYS